MLVSQDDYLMHEGRSKMDGAPVGSGRYPLGSGENPYQDYRSYQGRVAKLRAANVPEKEIAAYFGMSMRDFRKTNTQASAYVRSADRSEAHKLRYEQHWSVAAIAEKQGRSESSVRKLLKQTEDAKARAINNTADMLRESLNEHGGFIDIGAGSELYCGVSRTKFDAAVKQLTSEGYAVVPLSVRQMFGQGNTNFKLLCPPGTTSGTVFNNMDQIRLPTDVRVTADGDKAAPLRPIENVDSKRIQVRYGDEGGTLRDGVIELRRGVKDLDLGESHYAQVRIGVDGTHYLKGMAVYADDLPDGIDIRFNTNKKSGTPLMSPDKDGKQVLKPMNDPSNLTNPFGASIQRGGQRGALNIVNEEGNWRDWSKTLSSQFLSKQLPSVAKKQLKLTSDISQAEFDEIKSLTNPTLKRYLLDQFASGCDADAVHLKAAALPRQAPKVLLPIPELKDNEIYAPTYKPGEQLALVRYPHGGTFEIPVLTVKGRGKAFDIAKRIMGNAQDAVGINPKVAEQLSGADFDGDTVMCIPLASAKIQHRPALEGLKDFDPKSQYNGDHLPPKDKMKKGAVQREMGMVSNLITDMSIKQANDEDLACAVRHSMVVIDAYKHGLDYKQSAKDNRITELKRRYQMNDETGKFGAASTIVSKAKSQVYPLQRREKAVSKLTPEERKRWEEGEIIYEPTGKKSWKGTPLTFKSSQMYEESDARKLSSGYLIENHYADYANRMKAMGNAARKVMRATPKLQYSPSAAKTYAQQVTDLKRKLKEALMNSPKERRAQALAQSTYRVELADHPEYDDGQKKKAKSRHLEAARSITGSGKKMIDLSPKEWEAIQAGAVHDSTAKKIFENCDAKKLRQMAMPRATTISSSKVARARAMLNSGYTWSEIASALGVSASGIQKALSK